MSVTAPRPHVSRRAAGRARRAAVGLVVRGVLAAATGEAAASPPGSQRLARRVRVVPVATDLASPSGFTFDPAGRIWYLERLTGRVRILDRATGRDRVFFRVTKVNGAGERGALGIALHPDFPSEPFVYVYATRRQDGRLWNQVLRIRAAGDRGVGFRVLLRSPVGAASNHNGGRILVGPDRRLWIFDGDNANPATAQDLSNELRGKMLRIDLDGSVPASNPFGTPVWSYGHRNAFGFAFDPWTGRLWQTENGPTCNDEINRIVRGGNFAWGPSWRCSSPPTIQDTNRDGPRPRRLPKWRFPSPIGITGVVFCDRCGLGARRHGDLLFGAVNDGRVRALDLDDGRRRLVGGVRVLATAPSGIHSMEVAPNGRIFLSTARGIYRLVSP
jgi:glucose/arabinose dehydrogenase